MKSWSFSLALLFEYLLTCQMWRTFPGRGTFLVVGGLAVVVMFAGIRRAARRGYFADRSDLVLHGLVIVYVALEFASYELFHAASQCLFCSPGDVSNFHNSFNFCWCATMFCMLVGGYHGWALAMCERLFNRPQILLLCASHDLPPKAISIKLSSMEVPSGTYSWTNEDELLAALRRGQEEAFAELVRRHSGQLLAVIRRLLRRDEDAQDALQETFLSAFRGLRTFDGTCQIGTWLHRIAVNAALMKLRSRQRKPEQSIDELLPTFYSDGHRQNPGPAWTLTADRALEQAETRELVRRAIDQLPDGYRVVLVLRDIEQLDTALVAAHLEIDIGAVKTRLHRARQALRTLLDPHFRGDAK